jgi:hypothetical protein
MALCIQALKPCIGSETEVEKADLLGGRLGGVSSCRVR